MSKDEKVGRNNTKHNDPSYDLAHLSETYTGINYIQQLPRHNCTKMTMVYTHIGPETVMTIISPPDIILPDLIKKIEINSNEISEKYYIFGEIC